MDLVSQRSKRTELLGVRQCIAVSLAGLITTLALSSEPVLSQASPATVSQELANPGSVTALTFSRDGKYLASGGGGGSIKIWNPKSRRVERTLAIHIGAVTALSFSPNGNVLLSGGDDGTLYLWDSEKDWRPVFFSKENTHITAAVFSGDGTKIASGVLGGTITIRDASSGATQRTFDDGAGLTLLTTSRGDPDRLISVHSFNSPVIHIWSLSREERVEIAGFSEPVTDVDLSADGRTIAAAASDEGCTTWDAKTGKLLQRFKVYCEGVRFDANGDLLVHIPSGVSKFDTTSGKLLNEWNSRLSGFHFVLDLTDSLAAIDNDFFDLAKGSDLPGVTRPVDEPTSFSISSIGTIAVSVSSSIELWDIANGKVRVLKSASFAEASSMRFSGDGTLLATLDFNGGVALWDVPHGTVLWSHSKHCKANDVAFHPQGRQVALACADGTIEIHNAIDGAIVRTFAGFAKSGESVSFSSDGKWLVAAGREEGTITDFVQVASVKSWEVTTGRLLTSFYNEGLRAMSDQMHLSPDGQTIISMHDGIWEQALKTGRIVNKISELKTNGLTDHMSVSPDFSRLVIESGNEGLEVWDVSHLRRISQLRSSTKGILGSISQDPTRCWTAFVQNDGGVHILNENSGAEAAVLFSFDYARDWLAVTQSHGQVGSPVGVNQIVVSGASASVVHTDALAEQWAETPRRKDSASLVRQVAPIVSLKAPSYADGKVGEGQALELEIKVKYGDGAERIRELLLSQNGRPVREWSSELFKERSGTLSITETVPLRDGLNKFVVTASNFAGRRSAPARLTLRATSIPPSLFLQHGHTGMVLDVSFSPTEAVIASAGSDGGVAIWDSSDGREIRRLEGHTGNVNSVAFSPSGTLLASAGADGRAIIWELGTGRRLQTLASHSDSILQLAFSPNGKFLATASADHTIGIWNVANGIEVQTLTGHTDDVLSVAFSRDGKQLASSGLDRTVRVWSVSDSADCKVFAEPDDVEGFIAAVRFTEDGTRVIAGAQGGSLIAWDVATGAMRTISKRSTTSEAQESRAFLLDAMSLISSSNLLVSSDGLVYVPDVRGYASVRDEAGSLRGFDLTTGKQMFVMSVEKDIALRGLTLSNDGKWIASGASDGTIRIWDWKNQKLVRVLQGTPGARPAIAVSADGARLALGYGKYLHLWDLIAGLPSSNVQNRKQEFGYITFSGDVNTLLSEDYLGAISAWTLIPEVTSRQLQKGDPDRGDMGISLLNPKVVSTSDGVLSAFIHDVHTKEKLGASEVVIWDRRVNAITKRLPGEVFKFFDISADKEQAVVSDGSVVKVFNLNTERETASLPTGNASIESVNFGPVGHEIIVASSQGISIWDITTEGPISRVVSTSGTQDAIFNRDGTKIASIDEEGHAFLWEGSGYSYAHRLDTGSSSCSQLRFLSKKGRSPERLLGVTYDGLVQIWDANTADHLATLGNLGKDDWIVTTPSGFFDGSPQAWQLASWRLGEGLWNISPVESFFNEYYRPGLLADVLNGQELPMRPRLAELDRRQPIVSLSLSAGDALLPQPRTVSIRIQVQAAPPGIDKASGKVFHSDSGAQELRLFRNGSLINTWHGDIGSSFSAEKKIKLVAGSNHLVAYLFNRNNVKSSDAVLDLTGSQDLKRNGTLYVIAIGVDHYADTNLNLHFAVNDADDVARQFAAAQDSVGRYLPIRTVALLNEDATKQNVLSLLDRLAGRTPPPNSGLEANALLSPLAQTQPEDSVFIYFAGHGFADSSRFYLIPVDTGPLSIDGSFTTDQYQLLKSHSISDLELANALEGVDAGHVILVIDSCHSGKMLGGVDFRQGPMNSVGLAQLAYDKGIDALTASQADQPADESASLKHGLLTYSLIEEGLKEFKADDDPKDGKISLREWFNFAASRVPSLWDNLQQKREVRVQYDDSQPSDVVVQHPRIFVRREPEPDPFIVAARK